MASTRNSGVDRLMQQVRPRWDRERHERVFAAILERIRREEGQRDDKPAARATLDLNHAAR